MGKIIDSFTVLKQEGDFLYTSAFVRQISEPTVEYGADYYNNYVKRSGTAIADRINNCRTSLVSKYVKNGPILDVGIGSGEFILKSPVETLGYDINPFGVSWLESRGLFFDPYKEDCSKLTGFCLWDTIEHIYDPEKFLNLILQNQYVFLSLPIFDNFDNLKESKHWKPGEHVFLYSKDGLIEVFSKMGFTCLNYNNCEISAGRDGIGSFVFKKTSC
jgi:hypothetical protein